MTSAPCLPCDDSPAAGKRGSGLSFASGYRNWRRMADGSLMGERWRESGHWLAIVTESGAVFVSAGQRLPFRPAAESEASLIRADARAAQKAWR